MKQLIAVIALSAGFGVFADSTCSWTCDFGDDYAAEVAQYASNASVANAIIGTSNTTGSDTAIFSQETGTAGAKDGKPYLKVSKSVNNGTVAMVALPVKTRGSNDYTFSFDYMPVRTYTYSSSNDNNGMCVVDGRGNVLFTTFHTDGDLAIYRGMDSSDTIGTIPASDTARYSDDCASEGKWFRFTLTGDENGVTLAVKKLADDSVVLENARLADAPAVPAAVMVKTGNHSNRMTIAGLDYFSFVGTLPSGITEWTTGTVTESIIFGAALETSEAVNVTGGTSLAPIVFSAEDDIPTYGLTVTGTSDMAIGDTANKGSDVYFSVESGCYSVGGNLLVGKQTYTDNGDWSQDYITINGGTFSVAGNVVYPHGTMNVNGGTFTVGNRLNLANQNRASATINVNGGTLSAATIHVAPYAGDGPTLNVNGGTLEAGCFTRQHTTYTSKLFFNGGTLKALPSDNAFAPEGISFAVNVGGGTIDVNGQDIAIANAITGEGALTVKGGGKLTLSAAYGGTGALTVESGTTLGTTLDLGGQTDTFASATIGGTVTNGTLKVTDKATFTSGAVIDVGNLDLADGVVVLECGSVDGLDNLTVKANGRTVNYKLKYEASKGGIVLRRKGLVIVFQ